MLDCCQAKGENAKLVDGLQSGKLGCHIDVFAAFNAVFKKFEQISLKRDALPHDLQELSYKDAQ